VAANRQLRRRRAYSDFQQMIDAIGTVGWNREWTHQALKILAYSSQLMWLYNRFCIFEHEKPAVAERRGS
jgi:hypothetical protein